MYGQTLLSDHLADRQQQTLLVEVARRRRLRHAASDAMPLAVRPASVQRSLGAALVRLGHALQGTPAPVPVGSAVPCTAEAAG